MLHVACRYGDLLRGVSRGELIDAGLYSGLVSLSLSIVAYIDRITRDMLVTGGLFVISESRHDGCCSTLVAWAINRSLRLHGRRRCSAWGGVVGVVSGACAAQIDM